MEIKTDVKKKKKKKRGKNEKKEAGRQSEMRVSVFFVALFVIL